MKLQKKHIELASDIACIDHRVMYHRDPVALRQFCESELRRLGYNFAIKKPREGELERFSRATTIGVCKVWLGHMWDDYDAFRQAAILAHELVHAHQARVYNRIKFASRYLLAPWRWAYEMQANRQEIAVKLSMGYPRARAVAEFERLGKEAFPNFYWMKRIDSKDLLNRTMELGTAWVGEFFGDRAA